MKKLSIVLAMTLATCLSGCRAPLMVERGQEKIYVSPGTLFVYPQGDPQIIKVYQRGVYLEQSYYEWLQGQAGEYRP